MKKIIKSFFQLFYKVKYKNEYKITRILFFRFKKKIDNKCCLINYINNNKIIIHNENNKIIHNPSKIDGLNIFFAGKNNTLEIFQPCNFLPNNTLNILGDNCKLTLKKCQLAKVQIDMNNGSICYIGENSTVCGYIHIANEKNLSLNIGKECMFSGETAIWCTDGHIIRNNNTNEIINRIKHGISIGDHCWIGHRAVILKNTIIKNNTIVGAGSIVSGNFDKENIIIAGNPAKIIKENVNWDRKPLD